MENELYNNRIILQGKFDNLNKLLGATNYNRYVGNGIKQRNQNLMAEQMTNIGAIPKHCIYTFHWHMSSKREDKDNIATAKKYFFDALQVVGAIPNDNWEYIEAFGGDEYWSNAPKGMEFVEVIIQQISEEEYEQRRKDRYV